MCYTAEEGDAAIAAIGTPTSIFGTGGLVFIDYSASGLVGDASTFVHVDFFHNAVTGFAPIAEVFVPEPSSAALLAAGLLALGSLRARRARLGA